MGITGADEFAVLRNTASRNGDFQGILGPVKDVSVSVCARVREPRWQQQRTAVAGGGRGQGSWKHLTNKNKCLLESSCTAVEKKWVFVPNLGISLTLLVSG